MTFIDFLADRFGANRDREAMVWNATTYSYGWLLDKTIAWQAQLMAEHVEPGAVTSLEADYSPMSMAVFLALIERGCIVVLLGSSAGANRTELITTAQAEVSIRVDARDSVQVRKLAHQADHPLYHQLRAARHPGLVIFSSGSTGASKATVHDLVPLLDKFRLPRHALRTAAFLPLDHMGGLNTVLHTLSNLGCLVTLPSRNPDAVLAVVEHHRVDVLPVSPTFLNLVLVGQAYKRHRLATLKTISYGAEPVQESMLRRFHGLFPQIELKQMYGMTEVGILRSRSLSSDSPLIKIGGEGYETRVVAGVLQIKAKSAMLGYLNAPSSFTADGWLDTGDAVECAGEYLRVLGRTSEIINVAGEKVSPTEVESVIHEHDDVARVIVYGEPNYLTGNIVCARVTPCQELSREEGVRFVADVKRHCRRRLRAHQVPVKVVLVAAMDPSERFKPVRV